MVSISFQVYRVYLPHTSQKSALKTSTQYEDHFKNGILIDYVVAHIPFVKGILFVNFIRWWECSLSPYLIIVGFLLWILWFCESGDHPENNLAKFGYILDFFFKKNRILICSWLPTKTYPKKYGNLNFFWNLVNLGRSKSGENSWVKETLPYRSWVNSHWYHGKN